MTFSKGITFYKYFPLYFEGNNSFFQTKFFPLRFEGISYNSVPDEQLEEQTEEQPDEKPNKQDKQRPGRTIVETMEGTTR